MSITINDRTTILKLARLKNQRASFIERWLFSTWNAQKSAVKFEEIEQLLRRGKIDRTTIAIWRHEYTKFVADRLGPLWRSTLRNSGRNIVKGVNASALLKEPLIFDTTTKAIEKWLRLRGANLITVNTGIQTRAIKILLRQFMIEQPMGINELARVLRATIGVHYQQALGLAKLQQRMLKEGIRESVRKRAMAKVTNRMIFNRAKAIARTELSYAWNFGQQEAIRQARLGGAFENMVMGKEWMAAGTATDVLCSETDGEIAPLDGTYSNGLSAPPAHTNCQCVEGFHALTKSEARRKGWIN